MPYTSRPKSGNKQVLLVAVPFGMARSPCFSLSLLKSELREAGVASRIEYLTLRFAREIGFEFYEWLSYEGKRTIFLGEWVFFPSLWGPLTAELEEEYWRKAFPTNDAERPLEVPLDKLMLMIRRAQRQAGEMLEQFVAATDFSGYPIVGVSSTFQQNLASLALAKRIKAKSPGTVVVLGGANCDGDMGLEMLRRFDSLDVVFSGEADHSFPVFARHVLGGGSASDFAGEPG